MNTVRKTPLEKLRDVVSETVSHIQDFTKSPTDFIRNRKLNAQTIESLKNYPQFYKYAEDLENCL